MDHKLLNNCPAQRTAQAAGVTHLGNPNNYVQINIFPKQKLKSAGGGIAICFRTIFSATPMNITV